MITDLEIRDLFSNFWCEEYVHFEITFPRMFATGSCFSEKGLDVVTVAEIWSDSLLSCVLDTPSVSCQLSVSLSAGGRGSAQNEVLSHAYNSTVYAPAPKPTIRFSNTGWSNRFITY